MQRASYRKLQSVRANTLAWILHIAKLPLTPNFAVPPNFGKTLVCTVHSTWKGEAEAIRGEPYSRLNANEKFMVSFNWFLRFFEEKMLHTGTQNHRGKPLHKTGTYLNYYKIPENKIRVIHNGVDTSKFQPAKDKRKIKAGTRVQPRRLSHSVSGQALCPQRLIHAYRKHARRRQAVQKREIHNFRQRAKRRNAKTHRLCRKNRRKRQHNLHRLLSRQKTAQTLPSRRRIRVLHVLRASSLRCSGGACQLACPWSQQTWAGFLKRLKAAKTGFLVEPFNPKQFADKILYLLEHPAEASEMGRLRRKTIVEQYDWRIVVKDAMKVYDEALKLSNLYWLSPVSHGYFLEQLNYVKRAEEQLR